MADTKDKLELLDLEASLAQFGFDPSTDEGKLLAASHTLIQKLGLTDNLNAMTNEDLDRADTVQLTRFTYVLGLMRVLAYLRNPTEDDSRQARVALDYVKHIHATGMRDLQLGRSTADGTLAKDVAALRKKVNDLAKYKAKAIASKKNGEAKS